MIQRSLLISAFFLICSCASEIPAVKTGPSQTAKVSYGIPYRVQDNIYYPLVKVGNFAQEGAASWYGPKFHGKLTSNKEVYDMHAMTAAHKTLPFNTRVRVVNLKNNREAVVRINDRGPFVGDRIIDLSFSAARQLDMIEEGTAPVRLTVLNPDSSGTKASAPSTYSVQIGVYRNPASARKLAQSISNSRAEPVTRNGSRFYRVLVGSYPDYANALQKLDRLQTRGFPGAFIVADGN